MPPQSMYEDDLEEGGLYIVITIPPRNMSTSRRYVPCLPRCFEIRDYENAVDRDNSFEEFYWEIYLHKGKDMMGRDEGELFQLLPSPSYTGSRFHICKSTTTSVRKRAGVTAVVRIVLAHESWVPEVESVVERITRLKAQMTLRRFDWVVDLFHGLREHFCGSREMENFCVLPFRQDTVMREILNFAYSTVDATRAGASCEGRPVLVSFFGVTICVVEAEEEYLQSRDDCLLSRLNLEGSEEEFFGSFEA